MSHGIEEFVKLGPAVWPEGSLGVQPGDLNRFAPMGPFLWRHVLKMPSYDIRSVASRDVFKHGSQLHSGHPFTGAPAVEQSGGTVYFDRCVERADVEAMLRLMGVNGKGTDYAAFLQDATCPEDRYLTQMRIVSGFALEHAYHVPDGPEGRAFRQQPLPVSEVIWRFIEWIRREVKAGHYSVAGVLGGNGDESTEFLAFGFMVENQYFSICRIWSRAWLALK